MYQIKFKGNLKDSIMKYRESLEEEMQQEDNNLGLEDDLESQGGLFYEDSFLESDSDINPSNYTCANRKMSFKRDSFQQTSLATPSDLAQDPWLRYCAEKEGAVQRGVKYTMRASKMTQVDPVDLAIGDFGLPAVKVEQCRADAEAEQSELREILRLGGRDAALLAEKYVSERHSWRVLTRALDDLLSKRGEQEILRQMQRLGGKNLGLSMATLRDFGRSLSDSSSPMEGIARLALMDGVKMEGWGRGRRHGVVGRRERAMQTDGGQAGVGRVALDLARR